MRRSTSAYPPPRGARAGPRGARPRRRGPTRCSRGTRSSKISKQFYGNGNDYMKIFNANKGTLSDPDKIKPGQTLTIP